MPSLRHRVLRDRVVVLTGASSGIGEELARELVRHGARVGLIARRAERLRALADDLGPAAAWRAGDVTDGDGLQSALDGVAEELGGCDVVVANAGIGGYEKPSRFEPGRGLRVYDVNLMGMVRTFDWALPRFLAAGRGHLVSVASVASYFGLPHHAAYCGSKAAMRVHCQSLRVSLRSTGIAVSTICPGFVDSELTDRFRGSMPFKWPTDRAARRIRRALERREAEVVFPWQMKLFVLVGQRLVPRALLERLLARNA
jgi:short-subunit dehydrogenase